MMTMACNRLSRSDAQTVGEAVSGLAAACGLTARLPVPQTWSGKAGLSPAAYVNVHVTRRQPSETRNNHRCANNRSMSMAERACYPWGHSP